MLANLKATAAAVLAYYPAALAWVLNGGLAAALGFVFHIDSLQMAAVTTIATVLVSAYTAWKARPVAYSVLIGSLATILTAMGAFGLHLPPQWIATGVTVMSLILGQLFHLNLTPKIRLTAPVTPAPRLAG